MPSGLEGHMLPGVMWEGRQLAFELNKSRFSPQLRVQGPFSAMILLLVTFSFVHILEILNPKLAGHNMILCVRMDIKVFFKCRLTPNPLPLGALS